VPPTFRAGNSCLASLPEPHSIGATHLSAFNRCHPPFAIGATHLSRSFNHLSRSVPPTFRASISCLASFPEGPSSIQSVPPTFLESISCLASFPEGPLRFE
jgi:hypothetical protein